MDALERVKKLTGCQDEELLRILLDVAESYTLSYTNRSTLPTVLNGVVERLAVISYNRIGTEGETARSEGGESYSFDNAPKEVYDILNLYRLARVGGYAYEKKPASGNVSETGN